MSEKPTYEELERRVLELEGTEPYRNITEMVTFPQFEKHEAIILLIEPDSGIILNANIAAQDFYGYSIKTFRQMKIQDINMLSAKEVKEKRQQAASGKRNYFEFPHRLSSGEIREVEVHSSPILINNKKILFSIIHDITERKQAEEQRDKLIAEKLLESEEKYKSVVDNIGIGVSLISPDMEILTLNNQMLKWFPHIDVSQSPHCYREFNNPPRDDICFYCPTYETLKDGEVHESVTETPSGDEIRNYRIVSSPIKDSDGKVTAAIEMVEDITDKRRKEEELQKYREQLEEMVKKRTEELTVSNRTLKKEIVHRLEAEEALVTSSEKIKHFAYSVSHDLKNPSISIYGLTKLLNKQYENILDERGKNYCQQILQSSKQIASLVEMINIYLTAKEMPLHIESINLGDLLVMIREEFAVPLNIRQIEWVEPQQMPVVRADRIAMLRVLRNFVDNALKYGGEGLSEIVIGYREDEEYHTIYVRDDGIGLTEEDTQDIFGLFKRQKTASGILGSGLGLAIVKEIAEQHGGKVWSEVSSKKGITFNVSISKKL